MLIVHHLENSRSQRVLWLLEELGTQYEIRSYKRDARTGLAPAELRQVHPLGKSPVVEDDGHTLVETGAIVEYLLGRHGQGRLVPPDGSEAALTYRFWLHFAEGSAMPPLVMTLLLRRAAARLPAPLRPVGRMLLHGIWEGYLEPTITPQLDLSERALAGGGWFAGDELTGADIMMSFPMEAAADRVGLGERPAIKAWLTKIHARPAYRTALAKGGPYAYA
ncbi:MAG: glutathione S-transferase [Acetobacteraceae bacterium]|nr:glutathione S-transferase [Acetobacteraceae bacterium]